MASARLAAGQRQRAGTCIRFQRRARVRRRGPTEILASCLVRVARPHSRRVRAGQRRGRRLNGLADRRPLGLVTQIALGPWRSRSTLPGHDRGIDFDLRPDHQRSPASALPHRRRHRRRRRRRTSGPRVPSGLCHQRQVLRQRDDRQRRQPIEGGGVFALQPDHSRVHRLEQSQRRQRRRSLT